MKRILPLIFVLIGLNVNAQKTIKGKLEELKGLTKRDLVVAIYEEDKKVTGKLIKKISKTKKEEKRERLEKNLKDYRRQINYFNEAIREIVPKYWKLNNTSTVKYYTRKKIDELQKQDNNKYAVLNLMDEDVYTQGNYISHLELFHEYHKVNIKAITYGPSEGKRRKSLYKNHLINTNYNFPEKPKEKQKQFVESLEKEREGREKILSKENLIVTLILTQHHIKKAFELDDKISFQDFLEEEAKQNCKQLDGKKVLLQSAIVHGKILNELKKYYPKGELELVSAQRIADAINNQEDVIIGFPVIKKLVKMKGNIGLFKSLTIRPMDNKIFMNAKTKKVLAIAKHSGILAFRDFRKKDFEKIINQCK